MYLLPLITVFESLNAAYVLWIVVLTISCECGARVVKSTAVVLLVPPLISLKDSPSVWTAAQPIRAAPNGFCGWQQHEPDTELWFLTLPAAHRTQCRAGSWLSPSSATGCCLLKLLAAEDTWSCSESLHCLVFSYIWMTIFATMKTRSLFLQIKCSFCKCVTALGLSFPLSPTSSSVKNSSQCWWME